jgi:hypothetical protein
MSYLQVLPRWLILEDVVLILNGVEASSLRGKAMLDREEIMIIESQLLNPVP